MSKNKSLHQKTLKVTNVYRYFGNNIVNCFTMYAYAWQFISLYWINVSSFHTLNSYGSIVNSVKLQTGTEKSYKVWVIFFPFSILKPIIIFSFISKSNKLTKTLGYLFICFIIMLKSSFIQFETWLLQILNQWIKGKNKPFMTIFIKNPYYSLLKL